MRGRVAHEGCKRPVALHGEVSHHELPVSNLFSSQDSADFVQSGGA